MLGLTRVRAGDRGAIAMIVAMLFGFGVMLGLAALTIDVGSINAERRTLQNGSDAAAMAAARTCVSTGTCPVSTDSTLVQLVDGNAPDHFTKIARVDGKAAVCGVITSDTSLAKCEPLQPGLYDCPIPAKLPAEYIRVYTQTQNSATSTDTILPPIFGQMVVGGYQGVTQQTCASVGVESLGSSYHALPIVIAQCAYDAMVEKNAKPGNPQGPFPLMPPYKEASQTTPQAFPTASGVLGPTVAMDYSKYATKLFTHTTNGAGGPVNDPMKCDKSTSGLYLAGGFGWTDTVDGTHCETNFTSDTGPWVMPSGNGAAIPDGCRSNNGTKPSGTSPKAFVGNTTYIPIVISISGGNYIIDGLAGFYVAGYRSPAASPNNYDGYTGTGALTISSPDVGFWGWFTDKYVPSGSPGGTENPRGPKVLGYIG